MGAKMFKISNLTAEVEDVLTTIHFTLTFWDDTCEWIILDAATITNQFGHSTSSVYDTKVFYRKHNMYGVELCFQDKKKVFVAKSTLQLVFLTSANIKRILTYHFEAAVNKFHMIPLDKLMMQEEMDRCQKILEDQRNHGFETGPGPTPPPPPQEDSPLKKYLDALECEKKFLINAGGKKYKITNGKLILVEKGTYSYVFDMESELYIADDAPVTVKTGIETTSGSVLMCEDFQIIVQLESNIGQTVSVAYLSVEPWKLLDAMRERLTNKFNIKLPLTKKLFIDGPALATKKDIQEIPKGQEEAIKKAMKDPVTIIWGPPGTGKTHVMSEIAIKFLKQGKRVLMVSHSNVSVDGVAGKIFELLKQNGDDKIYMDGRVLRYGYIRNEELSRNEYISSFKYAVAKNPELSKKLDALQEKFEKIRKMKGLDSPEIIPLKKEIGKIRKQIRDLEKECVKHADIVATTISKVLIENIFDDAVYDAVMFDEVSMAYVPQVACALTYAKDHFVCVGDFMQLSPIAQSPEGKKVLTEDIFTVLGINVNGKPYYHPMLVMLDEQRRMHPAISEFPRKYVYSNLLRDHSSVVTKYEAIIANPPFPQYPLNLVDLKGTYCAAYKNSDNSRFNILSGFITFASAVKAEENMENISIITPYVAQTRLIRAMVLDYREKVNTEVRCATVHQFQGSESNLVLFDAVESFPSKKPGYLMGKSLISIKKLINVAITRSKAKFITVANTAFWGKHVNEHEHALGKLLSHEINNGNVVTYVDGSFREYLKSLELRSGPEFYFETEQYIDKLLRDLGNAKHKIIVSIPCGSLEEEYEERILDLLKTASNAGLFVAVKTGDYANLPEAWKEYAQGTDNAVFPLLVIDDRILWYSVPQADRKFTDNDNSAFVEVSKVVVRMKGEKTVEIVKSLSELELIYIEKTNTYKELKPKKGFANHGGLAEYISGKRFCVQCKQPLKMQKGKAGKTILWCDKCKRTELLSPEEVNHYIFIRNVTCPKDGGELSAHVGKFGLYIKCNNGHFLKPEEI